MNKLWGGLFMNDDTSNSFEKTSDLHNKNYSFKKADFNILKKALIETNFKHGVNQVKFVLKKVLDDDSDWYIYLSGESRDMVYDLGADKIREIIDEYADTNKKDKYDIVDSFVQKLYDEDELFRISVDRLICPTLKENNKENQDYFDDYLTVIDGKRLIIIGDVSDEQLNDIYNEQLQKHGKNAIKEVLNFDYDTIGSQMEIGDTVNLGVLGYMVFKDESGVIMIYDDNEIVYIFPEYLSVSD